MGAPLKKAILPRPFTPLINQILLGPLEVGLKYSLHFCSEMVIENDSICLGIMLSVLNVLTLYLLGRMKKPVDDFSEDEQDDKN